MGQDKQPRHAEPDTHAQGPLELVTHRGQARGVGQHCGNADTIGVVGPPSWVADKSITPLAAVL